MSSKTEIRLEFNAAKDKAEYLNELRAFLHTLSPCASHPVDLVRWVPIDMVTANSYNPNSVATNEMRLLATSVRADGYTQPVVTQWDAELKKYVVIDGFHRYTTLRNCPDVAKTTGGLIPIVVLEGKSINDRMASTIRHNRARGKHSVAGMGSMVFELLQQGWKDEQICKELGLEAEELLRLKHVTGFSKLFEDVEYKQAWTTPEAIKIKKERKEKK